MKKQVIFSTIILFVMISCGLTTANNQNEETSGSKNEPVQQRPRVEISTTYGKMIVELYNETPLHRDNFLKLVNEGFYDGTLFHRVIQGFMIQGGDPDSKTATRGQTLGMGGPAYNIPAEFVPALFHKKGALSAARMGDQVNPARESSGSQFYIVQGRPFSAEELDNFEQRSGNPFTPEQRSIYTTIGGTPHLDHAYTVFGHVVEGLDVLDKIAAVSKDRRDRPIEDIKMTMKVIN